MFGGDASSGKCGLAVSCSATLTNVIGAHCGGETNIGGACVAWKSDGTAEAWGLRVDQRGTLYGGDVMTANLTNVVGAHCGSFACVAWKADGTAEAWGRQGQPHISFKPENWTHPFESLSNFKIGGSGAKALYHNGSDVRFRGPSDCDFCNTDWGSTYGGIPNFGGDASSANLTNVVGAMCGGTGCVAWKADGTAESWGQNGWTMVKGLGDPLFTPTYDTLGRGPNGYTGNSSSAGLTNVAGVHCGSVACVAWRADGSATAWGDPMLGLDTPSVDFTTDVVGSRCGTSGQQTIRQRCRVSPKKSLERSSHALHQHGARGSDGRAAQEAQRRAGCGGGRSSR